MSTSTTIRMVETVRPRVQPNLLFVRLHAGDGRIGLGEAFFGARAVEAYLHETVAPALFALPDPTPERAARHLAPYLGYQGGGVETRGNGAVDLALWDLLGQRARMPLVRLLGGPYRDEIRVYNTCAGPGYVSRSSRQDSANWGLSTSDLEDLDAFLNRPADLARELRAGLDVLAAIRTAVDLDLMVELHGLWAQRCATLLVNEIARFDPYWVEDPIRPDAVDALARLADSTGVPIATGETVAGKRGFAALLAAGVPDVATVDVQWTGGLTEAHKIAALADTHGVPVAPHDCTGPVTFAAAVHLVCAVPNGLIQETVRAFRRTWYPEVVTGIALHEDFARAADVMVSTA